MTHGILVDAGPLVAILNKRDNDHAACVRVLKKVRRPFLTTWMPITEAMYLLDFSIRAQNALLEMIERGAIRLLDLGSKDLPIIRSLMEKYRDQPMDFADASLVHVAKREGLHEIFTLDRRDFDVYRLTRGKSFTVLSI